MAYDAELADRIRSELSEVVPEGVLVTERKMFGGLGFMVDGAMAVAAGSSGALMVRVDPADGARLVAECPGTTPMVMQGREMAGWLLVDRVVLDDDAELRRWVERGSTYAGSLPPKPAKPAKKTTSRKTAVKKTTAE